MVASTSPAFLFPHHHLLLLLKMCAIFEGCKAGDLLTFNSKLIATGMSVVGDDVKHITT